MSRVGLSNIKIPDGVTVIQDADKISAKGKVGELSVKTNEFINIKIGFLLFIKMKRLYQKDFKIIQGALRTR